MSFYYLCLQAGLKQVEAEAVAEAKASARVKREREEEIPASSDSASYPKRARGYDDSSQVSGSTGELEYPFSRSAKSTAADLIDLTGD